MTVPEVIIFDYGNVLEGPLDEPSFQTDLSTLARQYGFEEGIDLWYHLYRSEAWEEAKRGRITRERFWENRLGAIGITTEEGRTTFKARLFRHRGLRPEMCALLYTLRGRYRLAVLSNTSRPDLADYLARRRGLKDIFEVVVGSAAVGTAKPEVEIYCIALDRLNIQPEQALFTDDQARNTGAAEALGIQSIVFTSPGDLCVELERRNIL